ncbi:hypothetical protein TCAL_00486 [Tigriopus californicus]|uniref:TM2 domain-containing protein n=1 Tax=Tigriopus californicus TaxID=6832 RepID=A0A553NC74_TIGCA|nr:TM2 domain-containing protein CG10795-like [Tigriopus californicus]TRY63015.1 hypothetical protein TCAL_00486 [Tigriopus californicus]|eukprot:TCALIF_00486-PA protein Name:"Similar to CG10795 TM2 domain-containing protein CG10795 (Drosophila melanogaster)" AED:0.08 eAED:0.08 QI:0/-1/0/1/-1/1/1/0/245
MGRGTQLGVVALILFKSYLLLQPTDIHGQEFSSDRLDVDLTQSNDEMSALPEEDLEQALEHDVADSTPSSIVSHDLYRGLEIPPNRIYRDCPADLLPGQFLCTDLPIDPETQQPRNCHPQTRLAPAPCQAVPGIICRETGNGTFTRPIACQWTNGYDFDTALVLSVFLGMFGADRFYLGYPAIGLLKFSTLGFFFLGHLLDVMLIGSQVVGPADGSDYIIGYFGAKIQIVSMDNETLRKPQSDWY